MSRYLTTLFFAFLCGLLAIPILAQAGECGVGGTARNVYGVPVTKTDLEATQERARIGADGYWWTCGAEASKPEPADCYPPTAGAFRAWVVGEHRCTTWRKGATLSSDPARDRTIRHGETAHWQQWTGPMRGQIIEWCQDGVRHIVGASCAPVTHCDSRWSTSADGGKTVYVIDARGARRVPVGQAALAVAADGKSFPVRCTVNGFER